MPNLAVLASGTGSNFEVLCNEFRETDLFPLILVYDRQNAPVLEKARKNGVEALYLPFPPAQKESASQILTQELKARDIQFIILAGFMKMLPPSFVNTWDTRILNIHPSLLPRHPGTDSIKKAFDQGDREIGITIHLVDKGMDTGPILFQNFFLRQEEDNLEEIEKKVHNLEHGWYPKVIRDYTGKYQE